MNFYSLIRKNEKVFKGSKNIKYFYLPPKNQSDHLIITFSGFHGRENEGIAAAYNYVKPLSRIDSHRLFILDDYDGHPCYYLGKNQKNDYESSVAALIMYVAGRENIAFKNIITCGSSKGGTAAMYFAFKYNFGHACVGAFQLKVGTYLNNVSSYTRETVLNLITGGYNSDSVKYLDDYLIRFFKEHSPTNTDLYIHAGNKDPHYLNHVVPFLELMDSKNISYNLELKEYDSHGKIGTYYSDYLLEKLPEITEELSIKNLSAEYLDEEIQLKVDLAKFFTEEDVKFAYYIYKDNQIEKKIMYTSNNTLNYKPIDKGGYKVKVFCKLDNIKITEYSDLIKVN